MTLRARTLLPISSPPLDNGMVKVAEGRIVEFGAWDGTSATDLGDVVLMPGLINAHCHLDYSAMKGAILPPSSFTQWVRRINDLKRTLTDDDYLASIARGFRELVTFGTTSVLNIESFPELMLAMPKPLVRTWWFYEMMDVRNRLHTEAVVAGALSFFEKRKDWLGGFGLSPHAPYTASLDLYKLARFCCQKDDMPFMTHLAETEEEGLMFRSGEGPLFEFLKGIGRDMSDTGERSSVAHLMEGEALPSRAILTHMNDLTAKDWAQLSRQDYTIVHCPGCHDYFSRPPFPLERFLNEGFRVCLGTDSLASNIRLSMFREMQIVSRHFPNLSEGQILELATRNGAAALGLEGQLGEISCGAFADLIALPFTGSSDRTLSHVLAYEARVPWVMVDGRVVSCDTAA